MTEQQTHLKTVIDQQKTLVDEIQKLNNELSAKREIALKLQGVIEYLTATGVTLPPEGGEAPAEEPSKESTEESKE